MQHKLAAAMNRQTKLSRSPIYAIRLQARPGTDGIRALRAVLKVLWRQHQLRCLDAREVKDQDNPSPAMHACGQAEG
jgi:hypothetical protein